MNTGVVGRQHQLARLRTLIDRVPVQGQVLVLLGEAGIGKSTLLASAAQEARAAGMRVLWATGRESETNIAFAGLHRLLSPVLVAAADLERRQARALLGALGLAGEPAAADLLGTGLATLTLLSDSSVPAPVLVIVDDAHWLDRSTLDILAFVGSRLETERVVLLLAARGHAPAGRLRPGLHRAAGGGAVRGGRRPAARPAGPAAARAGPDPGAGPGGRQPDGP